MNNVFCVPHIFPSCVVVFVEIGLSIESQAPELLSYAKSS
jgi:hypothetical protein